MSFSTNKFKDFLKQKKYRVTQARLHIFDVLKKSHKSLSIKDIYQQLLSQQLDKVDLVSVYRNIELFKEMGLIHEIEVNQYRLCHHTSCGHEHTHVLVSCQKCGQETELAHNNKWFTKDIEKLIEKNSGVKRMTQVSIQGFCKDCQ